MSKDKNKVDKGVEASPQEVEKLTGYVQKNYPSFKDKSLIIRDKGTHFTVKHNINGAPLFLSKSVI